MEPDNFDRSLRAFVRRRPFESFQIRFVDGESITVDHPEAVRVSVDDGHQTLRLNVEVGPGDMGRVIGKRGRIGD